MQETPVRSLGWEDPLKKLMAAHSNILAWRVPWTEESVGLQSRGSQRVGHNWDSKTFKVIAPQTLSASSLQLKLLDWFVETLRDLWAKSCHLQMRTPWGRGAEMYCQLLILTVVPQQDGTGPSSDRSSPISSALAPLRVCVCVCAHAHTCSVVSDSLRPYGL